MPMFEIKTRDEPDDESCCLILTLTTGRILLLLLEKPIHDDCIQTKSIHHVKYSNTETLTEVLFLV